jgi:hypothetical protein
VVQAHPEECAKHCFVFCLVFFARPTDKNCMRDLPTARETLWRSDTRSRINHYIQTYIKLTKILHMKSDIPFPLFFIIHAIHSLSYPPHSPSKPYGIRIKKA